MRIVRTRQILYDNGKLLKKILSIDMHKSSLSPSFIRKTHSSALSPRKNQFFETSRQKSDTILRQNAYLVKRLATVHSVYDTSKWNNDYMKHTVYRDQISKHTGIF